MAPMKRPAASTAGAAIKKPATEELTVSKKCKEVESAVLGAEGLPEGVLQMLGGKLMQSLGVAKEERHPFQDKLIAMISEVLDGVESNLQARAEAAEAKVGDAGKERASRDEAAASAAADLVAKQEALEAANAALAAAATGHKEAKAAGAAAEAEQKSGDAGLVVVAAKKAMLEEAYSGAYEPLKAGSAGPEKVKDHLATLVKVGKELALDPSLLNSLPSALNKAPESRGSFDVMVLQQIEDEIAKHLTALSGELAASEPSKAERAAMVESAAVALIGAGEKEQACKAALEAAKAALKEAEVAQKAAEKSVKQFGPELKEIADGLDEAKTSLVALRCGALATFNELRERSNVPPPAEKVEAAEAPPAEAPPAEAPPAEAVPVVVSAE